MCTHDSLANRFAALLVPCLVCLEETVLQTKLPLRARSHALDGQILVLARLVCRDDDVAQSLEYGAF